MKDIEEMLSDMAYDVSMNVALELVFTSQIRETETWKKFLKTCKIVEQTDDLTSSYLRMKYGKHEGIPFPWDGEETLLDKWSFINKTRISLTMIRHTKNMARKELRRKEMETEEA